MRTEAPLALLQRRLGGRAATRPADDPRADDGDDEDGGDDETSPGGPLPDWVPDGTPRVGPAWLTAVRADPGRAGTVALAAVAAVAVLVTVLTLIGAHPEPVAAAKLPPVQTATMPTSAVPAAPSAAPSASEPVVVSVVGLVNQPGLVTLSPQARVADAVNGAGGALTGADTLGLNMARRVTDGEQIIVGIAAPAGQPPRLASSVGARTAAPTGSSAAPAGAGAAPVPAAPVDLNAATADQLDALPGVGPVTAAAIIAWRSANGRFASVDQLGEVDGIGPARLERLRPLVRV